MRRDDSGDAGFPGIVVQGAAAVAIFTTRETAEAFQKAIPGAGNQRNWYIAGRSKVLLVDWLHDCLRQGAAAIVIDPDPVTMKGTERLVHELIEEIEKRQ